jgi:4-hydroxy 2-oxovalerate aldolase
MTKYYDVTLRDGNHALRHTLSDTFVGEYCRLADGSGVWAVEVGHGNGLGASSFLVGKSACSDEALLSAARDSLSKAKLAVHSIPGFATIKRDLHPAVEVGVEVFRVATHVSEASVAETHIEYLVNQEVVVHGVLMMSHMIDLAGLLEQAQLMKSYGASAVILMDSAGRLVPREVVERVCVISGELDLEVGFHAHNNLGVAVANAIAASDAGAHIIDGASMGLGAGSGNAQLECVLATAAADAHAPLDDYLSMSKLVERSFPEYLPRTNASSIESGRAGVFSGYAPQVRQAAAEFGIDPRDLWRTLGERHIVTGQETMVREVAMELSVLAAASTTAAKAI